LIIFFAYVLKRVKVKEQQTCEQTLKRAKALILSKETA